MSRSPENTFVNGNNRKTVCSTKLLHNENATCSSSFTNNSGENSMENSTIEPNAPYPFATNVYCSTGLQFYKDCNCPAHESSNNRLQQQKSNSSTSSNHKNNNIGNANMSHSTTNQLNSINSLSNLNSLNDSSIHNEFFDEDVDMIMHRRASTLPRNAVTTSPSTMNATNQRTSTTPTMSHHDDNESLSYGGIHSSLAKEHQQQMHNQQIGKIGKYLIAVHRKITRHDSYFLSYHKTRPSLFGVPLLVPNSESGTNKDLYCAIWLQVSRLLSPLPAATDQANHAADW